jgi:anaerobic dimethyl sulfoxide reductase subunit B (iron-sulfur subunit)
MNDLEWGFIFQPERCIQCHGCEAACKVWRGIPQGIQWRRVKNIWHGDYPNVTCTAASISCLHCAEPKCVSACPSGAVCKRYSDGLVLVDSGKCTGCKACLDACPYDVPQFGPDGIMQKCDLCNHTPGADNAPPCVRTCPTHALDVRMITKAQKAEHEKSAFQARSVSIPNAY